MECRWRGELKKFLVRSTCSIVWSMRCKTITRQSEIMSTYWRWWLFLYRVPTRSTLPIFQFPNFQLFRLNRIGNWRFATVAADEGKRSQWRRTLEKTASINHQSNSIATGGLQRVPSGGSSFTRRHHQVSTGQENRRGSTRRGKVQSSNCSAVPLQRNFDC